jgi:hypothetical protein
VASVLGLDVRSNVNQVVQRGLISTKLPFAGAAATQLPLLKRLSCSLVSEQPQHAEVAGEETRYVGDRNRNVQ